MIPSLPIEINQYIIQLSLPPRLQTTEHYQERYHTLLACSLVSSVWREIAQKELIKHLIVRDLKTIKLLSKEFTRRNAQDMRSIVVSLRFDGTRLEMLGYVYDKDYDILLSSCRGVKEVWLVQLYLSDVFRSAVFNWKNFTQLESLYFIGFKMDDNIQDLDENDFPSLNIPSLTNLTFDEVDDNCDPGSCSKLLHSSMFPALVSLAIFVDISTFSSTVISESISAQLTKLVLHDPNGSTEEVILSTLSEKMSSLEILVLRDVYPLRSFFQIPPKLITLRVHHFIDGFVKDVDVLRDWITEMDPQRQLKNIIVPPPFKDADDVEIQAEKEFKSFFLDRGIEFEYSDAWEY